MKRLLILLLFLAVMPNYTALAKSNLSGGQKFLLFYSNDVIGETEPCG